MLELKNERFVIRYAVDLSVMVHKKPCPCGGQYDNCVELDSLDFLNDDLDSVYDMAEIENPNCYADRAPFNKKLFVNGTYIVTLTVRKFL